MNGRRGISAVCWLFGCWRARVCDCCFDPKKWSHSYFSHAFPSIQQVNGVTAAAATAITGTHRWYCSKLTGQERNFIDTHQHTHSFVTYKKPAYTLV